MAARRFTIYYDSRERAPLPIPAVIDHWLDPSHPATEARDTVARIELVKKTLQVADYLVEDMADDVGLVVYVGDCRHAGIVERKFSVDEIEDNVFNPVRRPCFIRLFQRMRDQWRHPILVIEGGLSHLLHRHINRPLARPPGLVTDGLQRLSLEYGVPVVPLHGDSALQRKDTAEYVARLLINAAVIGEGVRQCPMHPSASLSPNSSGPTPQTGPASRS